MITEMTPAGSAFNGMTVPAAKVRVAPSSSRSMGDLAQLPYAETSYRDARPPRRAGGAIFTINRLLSGNDEIVKERKQAVINARKVDRNNPMIRAGITKRAVDMVGKNLRLQSMPNIEMLGLTEEWALDFANQWENQFSIWGDDPRKLNDASRHSQFGAQMFEVCRNTYGADGEAALIIRYDEKRMKRYNGKFATFVEVIDPDRISNPDGKPDSELLRQGRQLDEWGAYVGLWVQRTHPSEANGKPKWDYVPRETKRGRPVGVHWFPKYRAGIQRAMPAILGALREVRMLDQFDNKQLEAAVKAAFFAVYVKTDKTTAEVLKSMQAPPTGNDPASQLLQDMDTRFDVYDSLNLAGNAVQVFAPGDELAIAEGSPAEINADSFRYAWDRKFCATLGIGYARFSGDYSKTSFASIRAELIDAWRLITADRYEFCTSVPAQIALAHLEECIVRQKIILPANAPYFYDHMTEYVQHEMRGPGMGWVDPQKDVTGATLRVAAGFSTPQAEAASQGSDFFDNIDATRRAIFYAKAKGINITYGYRPEMVDAEAAEEARQAELDAEIARAGANANDQTENEGNVAA